MPVITCWKNVRNSFAVVCWLLVSHFIAVEFLDSAAASDISTPPPRAQEAIEALKFSQWENLENGLMIREVSTALGTRLTTIKIPVAEYRFSIEQQKTPLGERASSVLERTGGVIVVNGGFFGQKADGKLFPVGQLIDDGNSVSNPWAVIGGYLAFDHDGKPEITLSAEGSPMWAKEAVQTKPVLIEAGGKWAMNTNGNEPERRTLLCILPQGDVLLMLVSGGGLTLFEAGWVMRGQKWGGYYDCDRAIALDGGGSTQLKIRNQPQLDITSLTPVQNLLVVHKRAE